MLSRSQARTFAPRRVLPLPLRPAAAAGELDRALAYAFAPMYKLAFGVAIGVAGGLVLFALTAVRLLVGPAERTDLALLSQFFAGYGESWPGAFVGLAWGFGVGFVAGWFTAFVRNLVCAVWLLVVRVRADLEASHEFLDHI